MIKIDSLDFFREKVGILRSLTLEIEAGEAVSVVGPNGAGKTTFLKCLCRLLQVPDRKIFLKGRCLNSFSRTELSRKIGYVPQGTVASNLPYTVLDFVRMGRYPYQGPFSRYSPRDLEAVEEAMDQTGISRLRDRFLFELSGGEQQKVQLAAALAQSPEILLLDEPGAHLDPGWNAEITRILKRINRKQGATIVMATHDLNTAISNSDRILALKEGRIHYLGESPGFADAGILESLFNYPFSILNDPGSGKKVLPKDIK